MGPKIRKAKRDNAASRVQKFMRGYLAHKHIEKEMATTKIGNTAAFFTSMRNEYRLSAQILVAYHMRRYLKRKRAEDKAEAEAKKNNKAYVPKPKPPPSGGNPNMLKKKLTGVPIKRVTT